MALTMPDDAGIAVAYGPGVGYVLVGGEHRAAALAQRNTYETNAYVVASWRDFVAWMIADLDRPNSHGWTLVDAAYLYEKAVRLLKPSRQDKPADDIAEYAGVNRGALDNVRWLIGVAADGAEEPEIRQFARDQLALITEGVAGGHGARDRVKQERDRLAAAAAPRMSADKQRQMLNDTIAKLWGMLAGLNTLGELNPELTQAERDEYAAHLGKINTGFIRLRTRLKE